MTLPQHQDPHSQSRRATAPYNFVPLPEAVVPAPALPPHDRYDPALHTGVLHCTLTTETPLYTRAALEPDEYGKQEAKDKPDFFYVDPSTKEPVIPGSGLRGMLRELVEIVGYGKVQPVSRESLVYRAVGEGTRFGQSYRDRLMHQDAQPKHYTPLVHAGYMEQDGYDWRIRPAQKINGTTFARIWHESVPRGLLDWHSCKNARTLWIDPGPYEYKDVREGYIHVKYSHVREFAAHRSPGLIQGVLTYSGRMPGKRFDMVVFPEDSSSDPIPIPEELVAAYREQLTPDQKKLLGDHGVLRDKQPIFYFKESGSLVFFGHTIMMRLPYHKSPNDFVPSWLRAKDQVDLAEAIFGYIGLDVQDTSRAGRISVSDARLVAGQQDVFLAQAPITPQILSSPKPTTFQHYLVQQTPETLSSGKPVLAHYASKTPQETVIRGHKLYWHRGEIGQEQIAERERVSANDTQHTSFRPLRSKVCFSFDVHFENLDVCELGVLLWVLALPGPGEYRHKLGMGKPLGMGAVQITSKLGVTDRRLRYKTLFSNGGWASGYIDAQDVERQALTAFEQTILSNEQLNPNKVDALSAIPRIRELLALLSWQGPTPSETQYITNLKEFTRRKVLPSPSFVLGDISTAKKNKPEGSTFPAPVHSTKPGKGQTTHAPHSSSTQKENPPPIVQATVIRHEGGQIVLQVGDEQTRMDLNLLPEHPRDRYELQEMYPLQSTLYVRKLGYSKKGKLRVTAQDVPQQG